LIGFASNATGAAFTLTSSVSGDGLANIVSIRNDSATNHSAKTITLVGTNQDGKAITDVVTGPGASATVYSALYFLTLTSATPSATIGADTFDIGWHNKFSTTTLPINFNGGKASLRVDIVDTVNYDIQQTFVDFQNTTNALVWSVDNATTQSGATAGQTVLYTAHPRALRLKINSYTDGSTITISYLQSNE
jgi:hypothetical protein